MRLISLSFVAALGFLTMTSCSSSSGGAATGSDGGGTGGGSDACHQACAKADALNCPMTTPGNCAAVCASSPPECKAQFDAVSACGAGATFTCVNGDAEPQGCDTQESAYETCLFAGFDGGFTLGD